WMPQPNSGRIGRSPGAVPRMISIASPTSSSPVESANAPRWSTRSGKAMPVPRISVIRLPSSEHDRRSRDREGAGGRHVDLRRAALDRDPGRALDGQRRPCLHADARAALDRHLALRLLGDLAGRLELEVLVALDLDVLLRGDPDLLVARELEGAVLLD